MKANFQGWLAISLIMAVSLPVSLNMYAITNAQSVAELEPTSDPFTCGAKLGIRSAVFSPNSDYILASWSLGQARLWETKTGDILETFSMDLENDITDAAFSPDNMTVATATSYQIILWNAQNGEELHTLVRDIPNDLATQISFSADGKRLLTSGYDGASLWDVQSGEKLFSFVGQHAHDRGEQAQLSPNDKLLITNNPGQLILWDTTTGKELHRFAGVRMGVFTPDSQSLITWGQGDRDTYEIIHWNLQTFQAMRNFGEYFKPDWKISSDGKYLLVVNSDSTELILWEIETGKALYKFPMNSLYNVYGFISKNENVLVPDTQDKSSVVRVLDIASGKTLKEIILNITSSPVFQISPDEQYFMIGTSSGQIKVWDIGNGKETANFC